MSFRYGATTEQEEQIEFERRARALGYLGEQVSPGRCGLTPSCNCSATDKHREGTLVLNFKDRRRELVHNPTEGELWQLEECGIPCVWVDEQSTQVH